MFGPAIFHLLKDTSLQVSAFNYKNEKLPVSENHANLINLTELSEAVNKKL